MHGEALGALGSIDFEFVYSEMKRLGCESENKSRCCKQATAGFIAWEMRMIS